MIRTIEVNRPQETPVDRLSELADQLPFEVIIDIKTRMGDYVLSGGKLNDPYMWQQIRFAENWIKLNIAEGNYAITD